MGRETEWANTRKCLWAYWPRQFAASIAWVANDFAFYGNKLQQSRFISILYPSAVQQ